MTKTIPNIDNMATLSNIANGEVEDRFLDEWLKVIANIQDDRTDPEKRRSITLTIELLPDETRSMAAVKVTASAKLAPVPAKGGIFIRNGIATIIDTKQGELFPSPNVVKMGGNNA